MAKPTYPLSANGLEQLVTYYPDATSPMSLTSLVALPAGSVLTKITTATPTAVKAYSSVQVSRNSHIELNSALLYMNHSCQPVVEVDVQRMEVRVVKDRDLKVGDHLTFFYPSSEWDMDRAFQCECGSGEKCLNWVDGAGNMDSETLKKGGWWLNEHIRALISERDAQPSNAGHKELPN